MNSPKSIDWPRTLLDACRRIERASTDISLSVLSATLGISASELQRQFTQRLGTSPKAYSQALQLQRLTQHVGREHSTLKATLEAGFESTSVAYATSSLALGVSPGSLRKSLDIGWWLGLSDLGWMLLAATEHGICWLTFGEEPGALLEELRAAFPRAQLHNDQQRLLGWFEQVRDFILLPREALDLPLDIQGTAFQSRVWRALRKVPLSQSISYSELAACIGQPRAVRAVAGACAANHIGLLIPCHRVIGADGRLAGYRWGLARKAELLRREAVLGEHHARNT